MALAKENTKQFLDSGVQTIKYEQVAVVSETKKGEDKHLKLQIALNPTEHTILSSRLKGGENGNLYGDTDDHGKVEFVEKVPIKTLLERNKVPKDFGLLTIDIEGADQGAILCKIISRYMYRPKYIVIEIHKLPDCVKELYDVLAKKKIQLDSEIKKIKKCLPCVVLFGLAYYIFATSICES